MVSWAKFAANLFGDPHENPARESPRYRFVVANRASSRNFTFFCRWRRMLQCSSGEPSGVLADDRASLPVTPNRTSQSLEYLSLMHNNCRICVKKFHCNDAEIPIPLRTICSPAKKIHLTRQTTKFLDRTQYLCTSSASD